ncbi:MAG TPA: TetR/AcrR family transcriptional regulator [Pseudonocardiaceae bacterium]|jgi:AcrR family transcriptional regulator|nr:TetR/AcrR family transcriptional regulator [Pseudonocardiaceae bacterium]
MNAGRTARDRARAELTAEIKLEARNQLATSGGGGLSLRAVARELGMVSSALYRYFASRDDLLTALIIDAYGAMADAAQTADESVTSRDPAQRWRAMAHAMREWALANRHEYSLLFGSPVPGYQAPQDTIAPAVRTYQLLLATVNDAWQAGGLKPAFPGPALSESLTAQLDAVREALATELPAEALNRGFIAVTQLFGMLNFELFGQFVGSVDPTDEFFANAVDQSLEFLGLPG